VTGELSDAKSRTWLVQSLCERVIEQNEISIRTSTSLLHGKIGNWK